MINKFLKCLILSLVTVFVILMLPFHSLYLWFKGKPKDTVTTGSVKGKKGYISQYIDDYWFGNSGRAQNNRVFVYFLVPSLGAFLLFVIYPFVHGLFLSLTDWTGLNTGNESFIGLKNYQIIFSDIRFIFSFVQTILYSIMNILAINVVAFLLAMLVTQKLRLENIYRAGFFMPNLIGGLVLGYIWQFVFNRALVSLGGIFSDSWLTSGSTALFGLIVVVTWQYAGYIMMIYIAAIQNIPVDLVEASKIDGATAIQRLKLITLPMIAQAFTVAMFLTLVTSFKQFDTVMSLTQGGPATTLPSWIGAFYGLADLPVVQSTNLIAINIYQEAFSRYQMGVGQAKAIVFFGFLLVVSLLQVYYNKRREIEL